LDIITYSSVIQRELNLAKCSLTEGEAEKVSGLEGRLNLKFGTSIGLGELIRSELAERKSKKWLYETLLNRINPEIAIIIAGPFKQTFIEVCKSRDIPVVELQHGVIYKNNLKHDFPESADVFAYPDYLLTFGEYWDDDVNIPIEDDNIIPVGYPYMERKLKKYSNVRKKNQIIVISQPPIGKSLSKFSLSLNKQLNDWDVVYKLHPREYDTWESEYPWLRDTEMRVLDSDTPPLYRLFAESKVQVGVGSTAIYEGTAFNLDTYTVDMPGSHVMSYLIERGYSDLVNSVDELVHKINKNEGRVEDVDTEYMFRSDSINNIRNALCEIKSREN
jgi:hypothetical protein